MKKTPNYIKKTLDEARFELLKEKQLQLSRQLYVEKLKELFSEEVIDLKENVETKMSITGTDKISTVTSSKNQVTNKTLKQKSSSNNKIIFLNNEIINQEINEIEEANNSILNLSDEIIELKDEVPKDRTSEIIELIEEVDDAINLTDEVVEKITSSNLMNESKTQTNIEISRQNHEKQSEFSQEQLEILNAKINDLDLNSNELTEKLDELLDQKNIFSEKFNDNLDLKLTEALNRSEDNLENKLNYINENYQQEFSKYENEANKNFANLEDQIVQLNNQFENIQNNINSIYLKIEENINKSSDLKFSEVEKIEQQLNDKVSDLSDYNLKIGNSLNNMNNKIDETLEKLSNFKNDTDTQINQLDNKINNIEPGLINKIEEKQKNKTESEKLQDKFDQMSKIMDMQNMRMLQMYHSSELQYSHSILQKNIKNKTNLNKEMSPDIITEELKKKVFPNIQQEMEKQFNLLKEQLSEYEIKSVLDKINSTDINREFKKPLKKFSNLFDAKKYVKSSITKKSRDWLKNNEIVVDEIAKKLLD